MHEYQRHPSKFMSLMIRYRSPKQLILDGFSSPFRTTLDPENRRIKLANILPWNDLAQAYHNSLVSSTQGRPAKEARLVIGAAIIKSKLCLSDKETVRPTPENKYLQFLVGLCSYQTAPPFDPSLFVEIKKRMGQTVFQDFHQAIIGHESPLKVSLDKEKTVTIRTKSGLSWPRPQAHESTVSSW